MHAHDYLQVYISNHMYIYIYIYLYNVYTIYIHIYIESNQTSVLKCVQV